MSLLKTVTNTAFKAGSLVSRSSKILIAQEILSQGYQLYKKGKSTEYAKHEFCQAIRCPEFDGKRCLKRADECVHTAKEFHHWLIFNRFKLLKF
jgi:hypothetical protein